MSDFEADVLFDLARQVQKWRVLNDPQASGSLDPDQLLELCKAAGYSEEAAQQAATKRAEARLDKNVPMFQTSYVHQ